MKVYGALEKASFEQIAQSSGVTPGVTGRVYADTTVPTAAIPRFYNGSLWLPMLLGQATALIVQTATKTVTVDWSQGLYQQVKLTDGCTINFINPQSGQIHQLVVTSATYAAGGAVPIVYPFTFNMVDQDSRRTPYQPMGLLPNQGSQLFTWFYSAGIKPGYATVPSSQPAPTAPATLVTGMDLSTDGKFLLVGQTGTPYSSGYPIFDAETLLQTPLGYKDVVASAAAASQPGGLAFSPDGRAAFIVQGATPYIQGYFLDRGKPTSGAFTNPATLPAGAANSVACHPTGSFVGVGHATTPFMSVYPFTGAAYGTKLTNPAQLPDAQVNSLAWSPQGDYLAAVSQTSPFIRVWSFSQNLTNGANFGAVAANPATLPAGGPANGIGGRGLAWRPQGDYIALAMTTTPYIYLVQFNRTTGAFGTTQAFAALSGAATSVAWTPDGQYLLIGTTVTPFFYIFDFSSGAPVAVTFDGAVPTAQVNSISVHPNGEYAFLALNSGSFLTMYTLPTKIRNYLRIIE